MNESHIKNFLKYDGNKIKKSWVIGMAVVNVCALLYCCAFYGYFVFVDILFILISIGIFLSLCHFLKNNDNSKMKLYFYYGIYTCLLIISCSALSYHFLELLFGKKASWIIVINGVLSIMVGIVSYFIYKKIIVCDYYKGKHMKINTALIVSAIILERRLNLSKNIVFAGAFSILSITYGVNIYFFIKAYCFSLVGEEWLVEEKDRGNSSFNRKKKKKS